MKTFLELSSDYDRATERIATLTDLISRMQVDLTNAWDWLESINCEMDQLPSDELPENDERFENHRSFDNYREPEERIWSAMQGGTDGG